MIERVVLFLTLIATLQSISFSQVGPFYPFEAKEKGVTPLSLGLIIGSFSIAYILSAAISGKYLTKIGKATGLRVGLFMIIIQLFGLSSLKFIHSPSLFIGLSITAMAIGGSGAALNVTCALAIINTNYPTEREKNLGLFEGGSGLGLLLGPLLGSLLYAIGGYCLPFLTFGIISLLLF